MWWGRKGGRQELHGGAGMSMCLRVGTWESGSSWNSCSGEWESVPRHTGKDRWVVANHVRRCESTGTAGGLLWEEEDQL